jgi:hypothetical protein
MPREDRDKVVNSTELARLSRLWQEVQELRQKVRQAEERIPRKKGDREEC